MATKKPQREIKPNWNSNEYGSIPLCSGGSGCQSFAALVADAVVGACLACVEMDMGPQQWVSTYCAPAILTGMRPQDDK